MAIFVTIGSKPVKAADGNTFHLVLVKGGGQVWSNEPLRGGLLIDCTPRKKGDKYQDRKTGEEKVVKMDGLNLNVVIGTKDDALAIADAAAVAKEIEL